MSGKSDKLDEATEAALDWAKEVLSWKFARSDPNFLKLHAIKAQASALVGQLKARIDPAGLRGGRGDRVGEVLRQRVERARSAKPN